MRDLLLDRRPKDFDIATSATPRQIKRLFRNCRIIGRRFRLAHIYFQSGKIIEVATFRARDGEDAGPQAEPEDDLLIRDDNVFGTPEEDALRRDFTINALFYDVNDENVIDHADGLGDLRRRLVRTIGDPAIRFREDPIRILRAIKFAARLDFAIEPKTLEALRRTRGEIPQGRAAADPRGDQPLLPRRRRRGARSSCCARPACSRSILPELAAAYAATLERWRAAARAARRARRRWHGTDARPALGEILAALLLAAVAERIGWRGDGPAAGRARGGRRRPRSTTVLRPIALRLRVSRRTRSDCRQILTALVRMVPTRRSAAAARAAARPPSGASPRRWRSCSTAWPAVGGRVRRGARRPGRTLPPHPRRPSDAAEGRRRGDRRARRGEAADAGGVGRRGGRREACAARSAAPAAAPARSAAADAPAPPRASAGPRRELPPGLGRQLLLRRASDPFPIVASDGSADRYGRRPRSPRGSRRTEASPERSAGRGGRSRSGAAAVAASRRAVARGRRRRPTATTRRRHAGLRRAGTGRERRPCARASRIAAARERRGRTRSRSRRTRRCSRCCARTSGSPARSTAASSASAARARCWSTASRCSPASCSALECDGA